jgi:hypothetical protein
VDGALLIDDTSLTDDSSATRILPGPQTGEAQAVHTETEQPQGTTSALDARKDSISRTGELKDSASSVEYIVSGIRRHKIAALISLILIAAGLSRSPSDLMSLARPFKAWNRIRSIDFVA